MGDTGLGTGTAVPREKDATTGSPARAPHIALPLARYAFRFRCEEPLHLPAFPGSAWRGAFGHALKRAVCIVRHRRCETCALRLRCAFPYFFDTPPPPEADRMRLYRTAPHPFVIALPGSETVSGQEALSSSAYAPGETVELIVTLVGRAGRAIAYVVHAFRLAGEGGIGPARARLSLDGVDHLSFFGEPKRTSVFDDGNLIRVPSPSPPQIPAPARRVRLRLLTPLRLKRDGRLVTPQTFQAADLLGNLVRRISMLTYFHADSSLDADFRRLRALAQEATIENASLRWFDWARRSARQKTVMRMGGLVGEAILDLGGTEDLWPFLWLGQWVHAGKGATMALGAYRIEAVSEASDRPAPMTAKHNDKSPDRL